MSSDGSFDGRRAIVRKTIAEKTLEETLGLDKAPLGPYGEMILRGREETLTEGAIIEYSRFMADFGRMTACKLTLDGRLNLTVNDEELPLWHGTVAQEILPDLSIELWLDDDGNIVRSFVSIDGGEETRRCTKYEALRTVVPGRTVDLMEKFFVPCNKEIDALYHTKEILCKIEAPQEVLDAFELEDRRQTIEQEEPGQVLVRVRTMGNADEAAKEEPADLHLKPTPYLQSNDPEIIALARAATGDAKTAHEKALNLRQWVYQRVSKKDLAFGFASAKEVAVSRRGDSAEHAVLLAALLRAEGIPSRVAVVLVYHRGQFAYHMWAEAFLNDWTALDASMNQHPVDATHIKLKYSPFDGSVPTIPSLQTAAVIGKLKIEVVEVK